MVRLTVEKSKETPGEFKVLLQEKELEPQKELEPPKIIITVIKRLFSKEGIAQNRIEIYTIWEWGKARRKVAFVKVDGKRWTRKDSEKAGFMVPSDIETLKQFVKD